jgi:hypothetical protein
MVKDDGRNPYRNWLPSATKIRMMESVMNEYGGMVEAKLKKINGEKFFGKRCEIAMMTGWQID